MVLSSLRDPEIHDFETQSKKINFQQGREQSTSLLKKLLIGIEIR